MLTRKVACDTETFFQRSGRGADEPEASLDNQGVNLQEGARACCMHCVSERHSAYRARAPEPCSCDWPSALAPVFCGACRQRPAWAAPHPSLHLTGQRRRVKPDLCIGRYEGTDKFLGRRALTDASLHSSLWRRENLNTCLVQPRSVAPSYGNPVRPRHRLLTTLGRQRRKKAKNRSQE